MTARRMRVAVYGAGAIGAFYGARMAAGGADVSLIARGAHLAALRERPLRIVEPERTSEHHLRATDDPAAIGPVNVVLFCVKSYDTESAAARLGPLLKADTAVVSLQNGVDNEERIAAAIGWRRVLGGAAYIIAGIRAPGVITASGPRSIVFGEWAGGDPTDRVRAILALAARCGVDASAAPDIRVAKWEKFTLLVAFSAMTATTRLGLGEIRSAPAARTMLRAIMTEVFTVGRAIGVALPGDLIDRQFDLVTSQAPDATSSLYRDLVAGHPMELEALQGAVARIGREAGVPTPWTDAAYAILQPWAIRNGMPPAERPALPA